MVSTLIVGKAGRYHVIDYISGKILRLKFQKILLYLLKLKESHSMLLGQFFLKVLFLLSETFFLKKKFQRTVENSCLQSSGIILSLDITL